eukprot:a175079_1359.p2 GENE.a175079_1359~~a175079_1359.p2  ORF type:complete len:222 (+),score=88.32 a175079_1359:49-666(+)
MGAGGSKNSKLFDELFRNSITLLKDSMSGLDLGRIVENGLDESAMQTMKEENERKAAAMNAEVLEGLWTTFDKDQSGSLDADEAKELVREYLQAAKKYMPEIVQESIALGLNAASALLPPEMLEDFNKQKKKLMKQVTAQVKEQLDTVISDLLANSEVHARQLLLDLDANGDGRVDKEEFTSRFLTACNKFISADKVSVGLNVQM